jgi:hypothetical protein
MAVAVWLDNEGERQVYPGCQVRATPTHDGPHDEMWDLQIMVQDNLDNLNWGLTNSCIVIGMGSLWIWVEDPAQFDFAQCVADINA